jgi:alanine racemase
MVMVKCVYTMADLKSQITEHHKVDYLGVALPMRELRLKNGGITLPIMGILSTSFSAIIQHQLEPKYRNLGLYAFLKLNKKNLYHFPIHKKIDTGMHRLGFEENTINELIAALQGNESTRKKVS